MVGVFRNETFIAPAPVGGGSTPIAWGTTIAPASYSDDAAGKRSHTWAGVNFGGASKAVVIVCHNVAWPDRTSSTAGSTVTVNGVAATVIVPFSYNTNENRYQTAQVFVATVDAPADGDVVFTTNANFSRASLTILPVENAAAGAGAFGTPSTVNSLGAPTLLEVVNSLTTTAADTSWRIAVFACRHHDGVPISINDGSLTLLREEALGTSTNDLSYAIARSINGATGAYDCGALFNGTGAGDDASSGTAVELFAA